MLSSSSHSYLKNKNKHHRYHEAAEQLKISKLCKKHPWDHIVVSTSSLSMEQFTLPFLFFCFVFILVKNDRDIPGRTSSHCRGWNIPQKSQTDGARGCCAHPDLVLHLIFIENSQQLGGMKRKAFEDKRLCLRTAKPKLQIMNQGSFIGNGTPRRVEGASDDGTKGPIAVGILLSQKCGCWTWRASRVSVDRYTGDTGGK